MDLLGLSGRRSCGRREPKPVPFFERTEGNYEFPSTQVRLRPSSRHHGPQKLVLR